MNNATRGVVLAAVAVVLGVIILWQGYDDPSSAASDDFIPESSDDGDDPAEDTEPDDGGSDGQATNEGTATDDDGDGGDTTVQPTVEVVVPDDTDGVLHPPAEVRVMVANGTATSGAAGGTRDSLVAAAGYVGLIANSTSQPTVTTSSVYYVEGYQLDAQSIATTVGIAITSVLPMPAAPPVVDLEDAHVLVELGSDVVPAG